MPTVDDPKLQRAFEVLNAAVLELQSRRMLDQFTEDDAGYVPASGGEEFYFLAADGTWKTVVGSGGVDSVTGSGLITATPTTGNVVVSVDLSAYPTGSGTNGTLAKWNNGAGTSLGDSRVLDDGSSAVEVNASLQVNFDADINGSLNVDTNLTARANASLGQDILLHTFQVRAISRFFGPVTVDGDFTLSNFTQGSVPFIGPAGLVSQDNANFFWDDANNRLGVGNAAPAQALHVTGTARATAGLIVDTMTAGSVWFAGASGALTQDNANLFWNNTNDTLAVRGTSSSTFALEVHGGTNGNNILARTASSTQDTQIEIWDAGGTARSQYGFANSASGNTSLRNKAWVWHSTATDFAIVGSTLASPRWDLVALGSNGRIGIGTNAPSVTFDVVGDGLFSGNLAVNGNATIGNAAGDAHVITGTLDCNQAVNVDGALTATSTLTVTAAATFNGNVAIGNAAGDAHTLLGTLNANSTAGSNGQILGVTGGLPQWGAPSAFSVVDGSGTLDTIPKWTPDGNTLGNSSITDTGALVTVTNPLVVTGGFAVDGNATLGSDDARSTVVRGFLRVQKTGVDSVPSMYFTNDAVSWGFGADGTVSDTFHITEDGVATWVRIAKTTGNVSMFGGLAVTGATTLSSTLAVNGNCTLGDSASADSHTINGGVTITASGASPANALAMTYNGTGQTTDRSAIYGSNAGTFNTTAAATGSYAINASNTASRSAGANDLINWGIYLNAQNGQSNRAIQTDNGDVLLNVASGNTTCYQDFYVNGNTRLGSAAGDTIGFYTTAGTAQQTVTGSRGGNAALADLLTKLATLGLIVDGTTA